MQSSKAWIAAPLGQRLNADERAFFRDERPWGYIVFTRNIAETNQLFDLVAELKDLGGRDTTPVFIDQEGGRINRIPDRMAPHYPPAEMLGRLFSADDSAGERAAWLQGRLLAADLQRFGVNADCAPCIDLPIAGADDVIGDRAFARNAETVATLGRSLADGLTAGGVLPVAKHIPGHGRAMADSHETLPRVDTPREVLEETDFAPFRALNTLPAAMTAHILYSAIDPTFPATLSPIVVDEIIRTSIGFDGLLMSDDMSMKALNGDLYDLTARAVGAGCDVVLHCNGDMAEMRRVAAAAQPLDGEAARRAQACEAVVAPPADNDVAALREEFDALVAELA